MDTEILSFLLGTSVAVMAVMVSLIGILLRRNGKKESNPNISTIDEKLNDILICLTRIEATRGCKFTVGGSADG